MGKNQTDESLVHMIEHLKSENFRLKNLLRNSPGSIYAKDKNGVYLDCNHFVLKMAGVESYDDIIGKTDYDMPWRAYADELRRIDQEIIYTKIPVELEEVATLANGETVTMLTRKAPLFDENGDVIGLTGISIDMTARKKAEEALLRAKLQAEAANQLKTEFMMNMQHDIRTPVGGVRSMLSWMAETMLDEDTREKLIMMRDATEQLEILCNEVIDFEKIEYGSSPIIAKKFDLHHLVNRVISLNRTAAFIKKLMLTCHIADSIPRIVKGDDHRTFRILVNLIGNAVKFTKEGSIALAVNLINQQDKQLNIEFVIKDTGIGIPTEKRQYLYEKFVRFNPSNQGIYKGSGLGLRIVKQFVEELDGEIDVQSKEGEGTRFYVTLPFETCLVQTVYDDPVELAPFLGEKANINHVWPYHNRPAPPPYKKPASPAPVVSPTTEPTSQNRIRLLLVEDDAIAMQFQEQYLAAQGFDVQTATNVSNAIKILDVTPFDAVLSDYGLPDGNGIDIIQHVKSNPKAINYAIPFYSCTAHHDPKILTSILDSGFEEIFAKPFKPGQAVSLARWVKEKMVQKSKPLL